MFPQGWWDSLDFLDAEKVREKQARADAIEAARFKDPDLRQPEDKDPEMNDIFSDFLREEQAKVLVISEWASRNRGSVPRRNHEELLVALMPLFQTFTSRVPFEVSC